MNPVSPRIVETNNMPLENDPLNAKDPNTTDSEDNTKTIMIIASGALAAVAIFFILLAGGVAFPAALTAAVISGGLISLGAYLTLQQPPPIPGPSPNDVKKHLKESEKETDRINQLDREFQEINRIVPTPVDIMRRTLQMYENLYVQALEEMKSQNVENKVLVQQFMQEQFRENIKISLREAPNLVKEKDEIRILLSSFHDKYPGEVDAVLAELNL